MAATVRHTGIVNVLTYDSINQQAKGTITVGRPVPVTVNWEANLKSGRVSFKEEFVKVDGKTKYPVHFVEDAKKEILNILGKVRMPFSSHVSVIEDQSKTIQESRQTSTVSSNKDESKLSSLTNNEKKK